MGSVFLGRIAIGVLGGQLLFVLTIKHMAGHLASLNLAH